MCSPSNSKFKYGANCLLSLVFGASALGAHPLEERARKILEEQRNAYGTPGMTLAVIDNGQILFTTASGFRDREAALPMTAETQVPAASISKLFTAALVMRQVEQGKLALDTPVNSIFPESYWIRDANRKSVPATLRQLLSHSGGLSVSWAGIAQKGQTPLSLDELMSRGQTARHSPGTRIVYANDGFSLAGLAAARADNEEFSDHASRILLRPLSMRSSTWESPWKLKSSNFSAAYGGLMGGQDRTDHNDVSGTLPAGGLISTAGDLSNFALMLLNKGTFQNQRILKAESIEEMWTVQAKQHPDMTTGFGLGFGVREYRGHRIVWWDGGLAGAANRFLLVPDRRAAVIVLSNLSDNAASSIAANRILDLLLGPSQEEAFAPESEDLDRFAGRYRFYDSVDRTLWFLQYALDIQFEVREGSLHHQSRLTKSGRLIPVAKARFKLKGSMMDDSEVLFDGDNVYIGYLRATRVPAYASPVALCVYAALSLVLLVWGMFIGLRALWRRRKDARNQGSAQAAANLEK